MNGRKIIAKRRSIAAFFVVFACVIISGSSVRYFARADEGDGDPKSREECQKLKLTIVSVPQYLFGDAKYATPVKFQITDKSGKATAFTINSITVTLNNGGSQIASCTIGNRFAADDGSTQSNGSSATYTCFVPASAYNGISLAPTHFTPSAEFVVTATVTGNNNGAQPKTVSSKDNDPKGAVTQFADPSVTALDMGTVGSPIIGNISLSNAVSNAGNWGWGTNGAFNIPTVNVWQTGDTGFDPPPAPTTGEYKVTANLGFNAIGASSSGFPLYQLSTSLYCQGNGMRPNWGVKNRWFGTRAGGYFYVSYGGRDLPTVLDYQERAMDLSAQSGQFDQNMFSSAQADVQNQCSNVTGVSLAQVGNTALAVAGALTTGGTSITLNIASAIFGAVASISDPAHTDGTAQGSVNRVVVRTPISGSPTPDSRFFQLQNSNNNDTNWTAAGLSMPGVSCSVGDEWTSFVELNSATNAVSWSGGFPWTTTFDTNITKWNAVSNQQQYTITIHQ